jgi:hypothetical protein
MGAAGTQGRGVRRLTEDKAGRAGSEGVPIDFVGGAGKGVGARFKACFVWRVRHIVAVLGWFKPRTAG